MGETPGCNNHDTKVFNVDGRLEGLPRDEMEATEVRTVCLKISWFIRTKRINTNKMSDDIGDGEEVVFSQEVLLNESKMLLDTQKKLTDSIAGNNCHGSGPIASSGKLKKDMQDQLKILFKAISKHATRGLFKETRIADIVCRNNGHEHCATVARGINKECENLRNREKWVTVKEFWGK